MPDATSGSGVRPDTATVSGTGTGSASASVGDADAAARATAARVLDAELQAAVVRALKREWDAVNWSQFRSALKAPALLLSQGTSRLGRWIPATRTIEIALSLVLDQPWGIVVEVLKHEIAHQYAHEVLGAYDERAHGEAFQRTCARLGIDPAASGLPTAPALSEEDARLPRRIAKLLALADSPNRHEAEAAMREAQRLMLKYNIDASSTRTEKRYGYRHLGTPTGRLQPHQRQIAVILGSHFFVEVIWVSVHRPLEGISGTVLEVCGSDANLEMAAYVHDFLIATAERLWQEHKRQHRVSSDRDRRSFLTGVMRGFSEKLDAQASEQRREGLVWVSDPGLAGFYDRRHPRRRTVRSTARAAPAAFAHGKEAGRNIVLHKPVAGGGGSGGGTGGRLLPGRRS